MPPVEQTPHQRRPNPKHEPRQNTHRHALRHVRARTGAFGKESADPRRARLFTRSIFASSLSFVRSSTIE
jgi:hypothetical protein